MTVLRIFLCTSLLHCGLGAGVLKAQEIDRAAGLAVAMRVIGDSLAPMYSRDGTTPPLTRFIIDGPRSEAAQNRVTPAFRVPLSAIAEATAAASGPSKHWTMGTGENVIFCAENSRFRCSMDARTVVVTIGRAHPDGRTLSVIANSTQMSPNPNRLHVVTHIITLEQQKAGWVLVSYEQEGHR